MLRQQRIKLSVHPSICREFARQARKAFPRETYAVCLGVDAGSTISIEALWVPDDVAVFANRESVWIPSTWETEARREAREDGLVPVGDIHSHPRRYVRWGGSLSECIPSEGDHEPGWPGIAGICVVSEQRRGGLRTRIRWFGPASRMEVKNI